MQNLLFLGNIGTGEFFIMLIIVLPVILCLIDILKNEFTGYNKIIWLLVVFFFNIIGVLLYLFIGTKQKIKN